MKHYLLYLVGIISLILPACQPITWQAKNLQNRLNQQEEQAISLANKVDSFLQKAQVDSIIHLMNNEKEIAIYIYHLDKLVYWSSNVTSSELIPPHHSGEWFYFLTNNAHVLCRWDHSSHGKQYNILTIIPLQHHYPIENELFQNTFFEPFHMEGDVCITKKRCEAYPEIISPTGKYLFSICPKDSVLPDFESINTISHNVTSQLGKKHSDELLQGEYLAKPKATFYLIIIGILLLSLIGFIIGLLIHFKGIRNMKLWLQIVIIISICFICSYTILFVWTMNQSIRRFKRTQAEQLQQKAEYITHDLEQFCEFELDHQTFEVSSSFNLLQGIPQYTIDTSVHNCTHPMRHLNIEDKVIELSEAYHTDLNFYTDKGVLLASSIPSIFQMGIMPPRINPGPFFTQQIPAITLEMVGTLPYLVAYKPVKNRHSTTIGYVSVPSYVSYTEIVNTIDRQLIYLSYIYLILIILSIILCYTLTTNLTSPIVAMSDKISQLKIGQYGSKIDYPYYNEIGILVHKYNELVDTIAHSADMLAQAERDSAWRTMARQIAHEINNSLTPMRLSIQHLQRAKQRPEQFDSLFMSSTNNILEQIDNLSHIAQSFSSFAKMPEVHLSQVDIAQKITTLINFYSTTVETISIRYIGPDNGIYAWTDEVQISNVFSNIIKNAIQAINRKKGGDIIIQLTDNENLVSISISDNGSGIPKDIQPKIFEPNFTTKSNGMGLGLAIAKNIIELSDGHISFSSDSKGTSFFIELNKRLSQ